MNFENLPADWQQLLEPELSKPYFKNIIETIKQNESAGLKVFPKEDQVFEALNLTSLAHLKVVIIGQDPYHGVGEANGLCFSVNNGVKIPPSLRNIYKELATDIPGFMIPTHGNLTSWASQGVLLLNTSLTVIKDQANSHSKIGWQIFTDKIIEIIATQKEHVVFILWGKNAQQKETLIDSAKHLIIKGIHPSPLSASRGFFGGKYFSLANNYLTLHHLKPINWHINQLI